jgi:ATP-dependent helicase/nuclease subunit A
LAGAGIFSRGDAGAGAAEFGSAVHELLAEVEWVSAGEAEKFAASWIERGAPATAREEALACLRAPGLAPVWRNRAGAEVWRERAFEVVLDGAWVTGVFDRVIVERDAAGQATRATVFDFKTDQVPSETDLVTALARHAGQLRLYRRVAARLAALDECAVAAELVLVRRRITMSIE